LIDLMFTKRNWESRKQEAEIGYQLLAISYQ